MRHQIGFIALSLLAAAFAGCSSADTTPTSSAGNHEPLSGALGKYNAAIVPLSNACTWTSVAVASPATTAGTMTVMLEAGNVAQISVRSVDKAVLVNGQTCADTAATSNKGIATTTLVKKIVVVPATTNALNASDETVIVDTRNGQFALAGAGTLATSTGISIDLGTGGNDVVAIAGTSGADKFGCLVASSKDTLGIKSATSKDVTFVNQSAALRYIIDLSDGNDQFDQNNCTGPMAVYGGLGNDTINAGAATSTNDTFSGGTDSSGTDKDVLSYAARTSTAAADAMVINLTTIALTTSLNAASSTPAAPFVMAALSGGVLGEADTLVDDFETITGSTADDFILSGSQTSTYTLNGGPGNDSFATIKAHPAVMNGNAGIDAANYSGRSGAVTAIMGSGAEDGETGDTDNIAVDIENYIASNNGDTVTGSSVNNTFFGGLGDDIFNGGTGDDTFMAAVTAGTSTAGDGDDTFNGGAGVDAVDYSLRTPGAGYGVCIILDGATASGICTYNAGSSTWDAASTLETDTIGADVENAYGTSSGDHIIGNANPNYLVGFGGVDYLEGLAGNDLLDANTYTATVSGSSETCNPVTMSCVGGSVSCTCAGQTISTATDANAVLDCGGDPLDIGTDSAGTYVNCAVQQ